MLRKLALLSALVSGLCVAAPARVPLAVVVNGQPKADVIGWVSEEGLWVDEMDARAWGLSVASDAQVEGKQVISLKGFGDKVRFNEGELSLAVTLDAAELKGLTRVNLQDNQVSGKVTSGSGMLLDYDLGVGYYSGMTVLDGALHTQVAWKGWQLLDAHSATVQDGGLRPGYRRTTLRRDWQAQHRRLDVGDLDVPDGGLASWPDWRGVGVSSVNYGYSALQASRSSASLSTLVQFPSTADIYVNGVKQGSYDVAPGVFDVRGLRGYSGGATQVKAVLRDVYGTESVVEESRYIADNALGAGSSEYSYQVGRDSTESTGGLQLRGVHRFGVNERLTLTARMEAQKDYASMQVGAVAPVAGFGEFGANVMTGWARTGQRPSGYSVSHQYNTPAWSTQVALSQRPVPVLLDTGVLGSQMLREVSVQGSYVTQDWGHFSARLVQTQLSGTSAAAVKLAELGWSKNLTPNLFVQAYVRQNNQAGTSAQALLVYRPGNGLTMGSYTEAVAGRTTQQLSLAHPSASEERLAWSVDAKSQAQADSASAALAYRTDAGVFKTGSHTDGKSASGYARWQGAAAVTLGSIAALPRRSDAAIVVDAAGLEGVGVYRNGTVVGRTDRTGRLTVGDLSGYEEVRLSLNENDIPGDYWYAGSGTVTVRPAPGAVIPLAFDVRQFRTLTLTVQACNAQGCLPMADQTVVLDSEGGVQARAQLKNGQARVNGLLTGRHTLRADAGNCTGALVVEKSTQEPVVVRCMSTP